MVSSAPRHSKHKKYWWWRNPLCRASFHGMLPMATQPVISVWSGFILILDISPILMKHFPRPLETAEENARRLTGNFDLVLPYPECDRTTKDCHEICPLCAITYCRAECRDRAWNQYHKTICVGQLGSSPEHPLEKLNEAWKWVMTPKFSSRNDLINNLTSVDFDSW